MVVEGRLVVGGRFQVGVLLLALGVLLVGVPLALVGVDMLHTVPPPDPLYDRCPVWQYSNIWLRPLLPLVRRNREI